MIIGIPRNSPHWYTAHIGVLSASRMPDALAVLENGKPGAPKKRLMIELVGERDVGILCDHFVTQAMKDGIERQPAAIEEYEILTGNLVGPEAFVAHPTIEHLGATPDGFIGHSGLLEVKCPTLPTFVQWVLDGVVPEKHKPQMATQLICNPGCTWVDFFAYYPYRKPGKRGFLRRFEPDRAYLDGIVERAVRFLAEVEDLFQRYTEAV